MREALNAIRIKPSTDSAIEKYVSHWDFCVGVDTKSYAFESFVRVNDIIKSLDSKGRGALLNHPSPLVRNITKEVEELGEASFSLFKTMWDSHLKATPARSWDISKNNGGMKMNWDQIEGQWKELKGRFRSQWGKLTDNDLEEIAGKKDRLLGKLQSLYGRKKDAAQSELDRFVDKLDQSH